MFYDTLKYKYTPILSPAMKAARGEILEQIKDKGGLYALGAAAYRQDEIKGSLFIAECFEQCHNRSAVTHWGKELVLKIIHYRLEMIRFPLKLIERELANPAQNKRVSQ